MNRLIILSFAGVLILGGCCAKDADPVTACPEQEAAVVQPVQVYPRLASGLIFDRHPGVYSADQFTARSSWPSTLGYYRAPEVIYYREWLRDYQGRGWGFDNSTYRRFDSVRLGQAIR